MVFGESIIMNFVDIMADISRHISILYNKGEYKIISHIQSITNLIPRRK